MYANPQNGKAAIDVAATPTEATRLAELRFMVLDAVNYSPYTTADEKATAAQRVANCQSAAVLTKWYCNTLTELAAREVAPPVEYTTAAQKKEIIVLANRVEITRPEKTQALLHLNTRTTAEATALIKELQTKVAGRTSPKRQRRHYRQAALTHYTHDPILNRTRPALAWESVKLTICNN